MQCQKRIAKNYVRTRWCFFLVFKRNVKGFVKGFSLCDEFILRLLSHIYDYSSYITLTPAFWGEKNSEREIVSELLLSLSPVFQSLVRGVSSVLF